jgi:hypothetical protein
MKWVFCFHRANWEMKMVPRLISAVALVAAVTTAAGTATAAQFLTNGNFESFTSGNPTSWIYTQGDGPATLQNGSNSPFTDIYPAGTNSLLYTDSNTGSTSPNIIQSFSAQSGIRYASWDFKLGAITGKPWVMQIDDSASALLRYDMDRTASGFFSVEQNATFTDVLALNANTWYHVEVTLNTNTNLQSGKITSEFGPSATWGGAFRLALGAPINRWVFIDLDAGINGNINLDNASFTDVPVPEPASLALLGVPALLLLPRRQKRR